MPQTPDFAATPLPDRYIVIIASCIEAVLAEQRADGTFPSWRPGNPFHPGGQTVMWPLAFLYATEHPRNPFFGDRRLRDAAVRTGDYFAAHTDANGGVSYDQDGSVAVGQNDVWLCQAWLEALSLLENELEAGQAARWRRQIRAGARTAAGRVAGWAALDEPYHTRSFGTSPNHAVTHAGFVYRAGQVFGEPSWCAAADTFMRRFLELQDADGAWPEYEGPVIAYAMITLMGVGQYFEATADAGVPGQPVGAGQAIAGGPAARFGGAGAQRRQLQAASRGRHLRRRRRSG